VTRYLVVALTAWMAVLLLGVEASLPYLLRRMRTTGTKLSFRERLRPHYWLGYALAALSTMHASLVGPAMARSDAAGIWAATLAWGLIFLQVGLGLLLRNGGTARVRRTHFWSMVGLSALIVAHVWRNG